ncbi:MAG: hypothetical protein RIR96_604 [Bacteroidota bacterium]|jgi:hypothetical protein
MAEKINQTSYLLQEMHSKNESEKIENSYLNLMFRLMNKKKLSPAEGHVFFLLRNKYEDAYRQLLKAINPISYQVYEEERNVWIGKAEA